MVMFQIRHPGSAAVRLAVLNLLQGGQFESELTAFLQVRSCL